MKRVIGIDYGDRRIGVAVSDPTGTIAQPHSLIEGLKDEEAAARIAQLAEELEASLVVVGLPRNMDGSEGFRAQKTRKFAEVLKAKLGDVPLEFLDERLTTLQAQRSLSIMEATRKQKKKKVDMMAASLLLQSWLDRRAFESRLPDDPF